MCIRDRPGTQPRALESHLDLGAYPGITAQGLGSGPRPAGVAWQPPPQYGHMPPFPAPVQYGHGPPFAPPQAPPSGAALAEALRRQTSQGPPRQGNPFG